MWVNGWPPGLEPGRWEFDSPRPDRGERTGVQRCLASNAGGVQLSGSPLFGQRSGIRLDSKPGQRRSIRRPPARWRAPLNGGELVLKTRVVVDSPRGSIPPLSAMETTCMAVLHTRLLNGRATSPGSSTLPVSSCGRVAKWEGAGLQPRHETVRFRPRPHTRTVVRAVRTRSSKPERRVRLSHGAQNRRSRRSLVTRSSMVEHQAQTLATEIRFLPGAGKV